MISRSHYARRKAYNALGILFSYSTTCLGLLALLFILGTLIWKGCAGLSLNVFTKMTAPVGETGGLLNPLLGTCLLTLGGLMLAVPIGLLAGTYLSTYGRHSRLAASLRFVNTSLLGIPSIIIGLFVYQICVIPFGHFSGWAGSVALTIVALPLLVRTTEDQLNQVPHALRESAHALGASRVYVLHKITYRAAAKGLITGIVLAIARMMGETAPLLFTSLGNSLVSLDMRQPMSSLSLSVYELAHSPYREQQTLAWTGALIITALVLSFNIFARFLSANRKKA